MLYSQRRQIYFSTGAQNWSFTLEILTYPPSWGKCSFACGAQYLGVEVATGLRLGAAKQSDAVVVLLASGSAALSEILSILQGQQVVAHPTWGKKGRMFFSSSCECVHLTRAELSTEAVLISTCFHKLELS